MSASRFSSDVRRRRDQHDALHDRVVAVEHRVDDQLAEAGDGEHLLGQHGARQQRAELQRAQRDDRRQRVAQRVLQDHDALAQALGARGAHVVGDSTCSMALRVWRISTAAIALPSTNAGMIIAARFAPRSSNGLT